MPSVFPRRIFFWILALFFLTTTLLVVFYALGYRFSRERGVFIYGGSITIKSNPRNVVITLDGQPVSQTKINFINGSSHIDGIKPGEYLLEVSAPGFQAWSKKTAVHSGISTEFWNVLLAKKEYPQTSFSLSSEKRFFASPKNKSIAYTSRDDGTFKVNVLDINSSESDEIFSSSDFEFTDNEKENIEWSPQSHAVIVPAVKKENNAKHFFIIETDTKKTLDLKDLAQTENLNFVRWDPEKKNKVYYISDRNLFSLDLNSPVEKKLVAQNAPSYDFSLESLYYLQLPSGIVYKTNSDGQQAPQQITTSPPADISADYKITVYDEGRIAFLDSGSGKLFIWNKGEKEKYFRELLSSASGIQFSDDGKKLLFWNDWEIFVYFTRDWKVQPAREENEILEVTRFSENLKNVQWSKDYEHVIFTASKKIKIAELDRRDYCNIMDIAALKSDRGSAVSYPSEEKLYFTDIAEEDKDSFSLFSINFPEKEGLLGL